MNSLLSISLYPDEFAFIHKGNLLFDLLKTIFALAQEKDFGNFFSDSKHVAHNLETTVISSTESICVLFVFVSLQKTMASLCVLKINH